MGGAERGVKGQEDDVRTIGMGSVVMDAVGKARGRA